MGGGRKEFTFLWFVENYSYCWHENGEALVSPQFTADWLEGTAWKLGLFPRGERVKDKGFVSLYLFRSAEDDGPESASVKCQLSFLAADRSLLSYGEFDFLFERGKGYGRPKFLHMHEILLPQDILTVRCKIWRGEGNVHSGAPICARTRIGVETISYLHVVENFSKQAIEIRSHSKKECFASSSLYFNYDSCSEGEMVVEITLFDSSYFLCKRKTSLLGCGNGIACEVMDNRFDVERKDIGKLSLSLAKLSNPSITNEYLPDGQLSLLCECSFSTDLEFEYIEGAQCKMPMATEKLTKVQKLSKNDGSPAEKASAYPSALEDMKALYIDQFLSDVELRTKTKSFPAHKNILSARSPEFKRMLISDMNEKNTDHIRVDDLEDGVVRQFLIFLYSDTVEKLQWEMATRLFYAVDEYEVGKLKEVCSSFLVENLTPNNAGELLLLADTHSDPGLKLSVENFILEHEREVFASKEWEVLMETNPPLVLKAMHLKYKRKKGRG